jgi:hypothetical protein
MDNVFTGDKKMNIETGRLAPINRRAAAIKILAPNCAYHTDGETILKWLTPDIPQPSEADIEAKVAEYKIKWDAQAYARARKSEYDALNQLELISDDAINGTTTHKNAIVAIKTAHPKPE